MLSLLAIFLIFLQLSCSKDKIIDVADLINNADQYNEQVITVRGCHYLGFELNIIGPCEKFNMKDGIWVEPYSLLEDQKKWLEGHYEIPYQKPEKEPSDEEKSLYKLLRDKPEGAGRTLLFRGEFLSSTSPKFGHLGQYKYQFILHRVLKIASSNDLEFKEE